MSGVDNKDNKNNAGNSNHSEPIYGKGEGTHFSSDELLLYLHQHNRSDGVWQVMHQHMLSCPACRKQVAELEQAEYALRTTLSARKQISYMPVAASVLKSIHEQQQTGARSTFKARGSVRLSIALVAVAAFALFVFTLGSIVFNRQSIPVAHHQSPTPVSTIGGVVRQQQTPTVGPTTEPSPTATVPVPRVAKLTECTTDFDVVKQHLRICGSNFKAGDNIAFTLVDSKERIMKQIGSIQVLNDGTFSQNISIHSCKDVPSVIYAQDTSVKKSEPYVELTNIWYPNC